MNRLELDNYSTLSVTRNELNLFQKRIQWHLKKIESSANQLNKIFEKKGDFKWWTPQERDLLLRCDLKLAALVDLSVKGSAAAQKALSMAEKIDNEPLIYKIIHRLTW
ncbi:MAG TPA: hypothetical protein VLG76_01525 [Rhabdochlamydiaceae bacterium]|nr:hypothetical protein [Rhabdochlamydiaceae bacterium]HSX37578.1 hypothetical protein [Chlamydiales bacterium]